MEKDYEHENFEDFIRRSADNLRMKAPERVWQSLSGELSKSRRRFRITLSGFFLFTAVLSYINISNHALNNQYDVVARGALEHSRAASPGNLHSLADNTQLLTQVTPAINYGTLRNELAAPHRRYSRRPITLSLAEAKTAETELTAEAKGNEFSPTIVDDRIEDATAASKETQPTAKPLFLTAHDATPWTIESVTNLFKRKQSRWQTEYHFTPTISYRKLSENKSYLRQASFFNSPPNYAALYGSVNEMVTHKPDIGFEVGVTAKYSVSRKVRLRGGLQFNVNRYDIKAFNAPAAVATIALNSKRSSQVDSLRTLSSYSNVDASSNKSSWLENLSFQVSAPIGVELVLKGNDKMQFGIATTVQPTYVIGDRAYMITTDYKSYTQVPWLLRRWNMNTAFETFVSYQTGKTKWQVGPQVRYQLLSSFISNYPVKENLFDFGLKLGISLNK